jgi:putative ABC transport system ATP-binding protein
MSNGQPAISIRGLTKSFEKGRINALSCVDLDVFEGEFVAIVGPSGCGKSTLLHLIAALDRPDEGTIEVEGMSSVPSGISTITARETLVLYFS